MYYLSEHILVHPGQRAFTCTICGREFYKKRDVQRHVSSHAIEKPFKCSICDKGFSRKDTLDNHMPTHTGDWNFKCSICLKGFSKKSHLLRHMTMHDEETDFTCDICGKEFASRLDLHRHKLTQHDSSKEQSSGSSREGDNVTAECHSYENAVELNLNDTESVAEQSAAEREREISNIRIESETQEISISKEYTEERNFKCKECDKAFSKNSYLVKHMVTHMVNKPFRCDICFKGFTRKASLDYHMPAHTGAWTYNCGVCGKGFSKKSHLQQHMQLHTDRSTLTCSVCRKEFFSSSLLDKHMVDYHTLGTGNNDGLQENMLDNSYGLGLSLNEMHELNPKSPAAEDFDVKIPATDHVECVIDEPDTEAHKDGKNGSNSEFSCGECGTVFPNELDLSRHKVSHDIDTHEKPYKCEFCFKSFAQKNSLVYHLPIHTGNWNFICSICFKGFSKKSHFAKHTAVHKAKRKASKKRFRFSCNVCEKKFSSESRLSRHMFDHADGPNLSCGVCLETCSSISDLQSHMIDKHIINSKQSELEPEKKSEEENPIGSSDSEMHVLEQGSQEIMETQDAESENPASEDSEDFSDESTSLHEEVDEMEANSATDDWYLKCGECGKAHLTQSALMLHLSLHEEEKPFKCEICFQLFSELNSLDDHIVTHKDGSNFKCSICSKIVAEKSHLIEHMAKHMKKRDLSMNAVTLKICKICERKFRTKSNLVGHMLAHTNLLGLSCRSCFTMCSSLSTLEKHMIDEHVLHEKAKKKSKGEVKSESSVLDGNETEAMESGVNEEGSKAVNSREYKCVECNKGYLTMAHMKRHMASHSKEKPFTCDICQRGFSRRDSLADHMPTHTGIWNFKCNICSKGCPKKSSLRRHMGVHTKKRDLRCIMCGTEFPARSQLLRHMMVQYSNMNGDNAMSDSDDASVGSPKNEIPQDNLAMEHVECVLDEHVEIKTEVLNVEECCEPVDPLSADSGQT